MSKYLFMDIDGVLNHEEWFRIPGVKEMEMPECWYDPECVARIKDIIDATGCKLVVTSIHRSDIRLHQYFKQIGLPMDFDVTPILWDEGRGREIEYYLQRHQIANGDYAILDDEFVALEYMLPYFVMTANSKYEEFYEINKGCGVTDSVRDRVIEILKEK